MLALSFSEFDPCRPAPRYARRQPASSPSSRRTRTTARIFYDDAEMPNMQHTISASRADSTAQTACGCGRAGHGRPSRSPSRHSAERPRGSSRTGRLLQAQSSAGHRLQPSIARAPCSIAWRNAARHRSRRHSRARAAPRRSGSTSAAREQPWPHSLASNPSSSAAHRPSFGRGWTARSYSNEVSPDRSTFRTVFRDTFRSRAISLIVLPLMKCSRRIRAIVSTVSIPNHLLRFKAGSATDQPVGGQFWTPIPRLRGSKLHAE